MPILTLILAIAVIMLNIAALVLSSVSVTVTQVQLVSIPAAIAGLVIVGILTPFAYFFKKDILCRISFFIDTVSLAIAIVAVAVGFSVL